MDAISLTQNEYIGSVAVYWRKLLGSLISFLKNEQNSVSTIL